MHWKDLILVIYIHFPSDIFNVKQIFKEFEFTFVCGYGSVNFNMHIGSCNKHCKQDIE